MYSCHTAVCTLEYTASCTRVRVDLSVRGLLHVHSLTRVLNSLPVGIAWLIRLTSITKFRGTTTTKFSSSSTFFRGTNLEVLLLLVVVRF